MNTGTLKHIAAQANIYAPLRAGIAKSSFVCALLVIRVVPCRVFSYLLRAPYPFLTQRLGQLKHRHGIEA